MPRGEKTKLLWQNPRYKRYMSDVHKGHKPSKKTKEKMSKNNCWIGRKGKNSFGWKNGQIIQYGYILIYMPKHPFAIGNYIRRSRWIMEQKLKRYLKPVEIVHHINKIRNDDRIENLQLFKNKSEHARFHYPPGIGIKHK